MNKPLTCPKCRKVQYFVCSNKKCVCWKYVPKGKKPQKFNVDGETISCPYCEFTAHADYWETREMKFALMGIKTEVVDHDEEWKDVRDKYSGERQAY